MTAWNGSCRKRCVPSRGRLERRLLSERVAAIESEPPLCPNGHGRMECAQRDRQMEGVLGPFQYRRGSFRCLACRQTLALADQALGIGPGRLTPGLSRIVALHAVQDPFGHAARTINETLGSQLSRDAVYRTPAAPSPRPKAPAPRAWRRRPPPSPWARRPG